MDQALCFGWIDGIRRRLDDESYTIRFTPRRSGSIWSAINVARVKELTEAGVMHPAGLEAFARRSEKKSAIYSYEQTLRATLDEDHDRRFKRNRKAWSFFSTRAPWYRQKAIYWIASAKVGRDQAPAPRETDRGVSKRTTCLMMASYDER